MTIPSSPTSTVGQRLRRSSDAGEAGSTRAARVGADTADTADRTGTDRPGLLRRAWRGEESEPAWARPAFWALLLLAGVLYLWDLGASGYANSFYSAAVQAGSESWKAFFFGSSDAANSITVDKTPLALWPMDLSVRVFGLSSWSILVPQAIEGIVTVALVHRLVRRATGSAGAGLVAGLVLALTPVAVLMFRFNNPDAMLVLLLTASAAATLRAVEITRTLPTTGRPMRWLALGGALVGLAFLAKMLQAFLVLPALALVYLFFARTTWGKRLVGLLVAFGAMLLAGGWWIAIVELWPAGSRPFIGGSQDNSILELTLGYNGFGRLTGDETGSVGGGGGGGTGMWGATGITRLFNSEIGGQVAWLLPAALILTVGGLFFARGWRPRAALALFGGWLVVTALTFSFMSGIFHAYYTVALAPMIAACIGIGGWALWRARESYVAAALLALTVSFTSVFGYFLLDRTTDYLPWLKWPVLVLGIGSALLLAGIRHLPARAGLAVVGVALVSTLAAPAAYSVSTVTTPHTGSIVSAGPASAGGTGGFGGRGGFGGGRPPGVPNLARGQNGTRGQAGGQAGAPGGARGTGGGGGVGGLLNGSTSSAAITKLLQTDSSAYTWAAAAVGSNTSAGYQLASEQPVMAIGGFNGTDPSPTLAQFEQYVANGQIHYFIASGGGGFGNQSGGSSDSSRIASWVADNFTATTVSGVTLYDLSGGVS